MSWHYSQALEAVFSGANSSGGNACAPSNTNPPQDGCSPLGKMTDASNPSPSGMTLEPSMESRGVAWWMSSLAASRAKTLAQRVKVQDSTASEAASGWKWHESSVKFDPASRSWKTRQCSLLGDLESFSGTWPRWGMMRDGECWEQSTPALRTSETESGLSQVPTPRVTNHQKNSRDKYVSLGAWVKLWPTPNASDNRPRATAASTERRRKLGKQISLEAAVKYPTPKSRDWKDTGTVPPSRVLDPGKDTLGQHVARTEPGGSLNPTWVEWLMGWPLGWTDSAQSAMDKFRQWCASHGIS
jgi:hypothetical protein